MPRTVIAVTPAALAGCAACNAGTDLYAPREGGSWRAGLVITGCGAHEASRLEVAGAAGDVGAVEVRCPASRQPAPEAIEPFTEAVGQALDGLDPDGEVSAALRLLPHLVEGGLTAGEEALLWALLGFDDTALIARARAAGMSAEAAWATAEHLRYEEDLDGDLLNPAPEEILAWWQCSESADGPPMAEVREWMQLGVRRPDLRPDGLAVGDLKVLMLAGVDGWGPGWSGAADLCPTVVTAGVAAGRGPVEVVALFAALKAARGGDGDATGPVWGDMCEHADAIGCTPWGETASAAAVEYATSLGGAPWADVAVCLRGGMSPDEARAHVLTGQGMDPVRLLVALTG